jgi:hypothetical protein
MKKILFELRSAINVKKKYFLFDKKKIRIKQYIKGLRSLKKNYSNLKYVDFIYVDNTLENSKHIPQQIKSNLPNNCRLLVKFNNYYGKHNKGAGDIEMWKSYINIIKRYNFFFHYEPRMIIKDFSFINSFLKKPRNFFSIAIKSEQVKTGCFGVNTKDFMKFIKGINLDKMIVNKMSIENLMYNFFKNKNSEFINKEFFLWHDQQINKYVRY